MIADLGIAELEARAERALVALVACLLVGTALFAGGWWIGASHARRDAAVAEQARTFAAVSRQAELDAATLAREHALRVADRAEYDTYRKEQDHAQAAANRLISDLRRDVVRLRVPVIRPAGPAASDAGGPAAGRPGENGYAELSPDAGAFVVGLLERGDEAIRKHAEVVKRYNRLAEACSQPSQPPTEEAKNGQDTP